MEMYDGVVNQDETVAYDAIQREMLQLLKDEQDYGILREHVPEYAPKSFGGYRRMRAAQSGNYLKLLRRAQKAGIDLGTVPPMG